MSLFKQLGRAAFIERKSIQEFGKLWPEDVRQYPKYDAAGDVVFLQYPGCKRIDLTPRGYSCDGQVFARLEFAIQHSAG